MTLWKKLRKRMEQYPLQTVSELNAVITYEQLIIFAETYSEKLKDEKCCAIYCKSEMAAGMALLACFAANVTAVPLSLRYGEKHCMKIIDAVDPTCIITDHDGELVINHIKDSNYIPPKCSPALIMFTSGTTGMPKGAMLSSNNIWTNVTDISTYFQINKSDTILISRPLYHCAVLTGEFLTSLYNGLNIVMCSESFNPKTIIDILTDKKITTFCGTPTLLTMLSNFIRTPKELDLKNIVVSGECMSTESGLKLKSKFESAKIYHVYGLTEASPRVSYLPPEKFALTPNSVGIPLKSVQIKILTEDGQTVEDGECGILWVKGKNVMVGYYNNPDATRKIFKDGWLCTGDIAFIKSGLLYIKCRNDDLIIRAGMNIYPQEIENELKKDSRVDEVVVYGENNQKYGTQICLEIVGNFIDENEIRKLCHELLPSFQVPEKIKLVKEIRKNGTGKVVRKHVRI